MRIIIISAVLLLCESVFCQVRDVETKIFDLFVFSSNGFLTGVEDLRYHPSRMKNSSNHALEMKIKYHDTYREWGGENNNKKNIYQYDVGLTAAMPFTLFGKSFHSYTSIVKQTNSSAYPSEYKEAELSGSNFGAYSISNALQFNGIRDRVGGRIQYSTGTSSINLLLNQYPRSLNDASLNKYFYDLLETAFGNNVGFDLTGNELNYSLEYTRTISSSFNIGFNFYQEINNYNAGIHYYSSVEKIAGAKKLDGLLHVKWYTPGISCEYKLNDVTLRSSLSYSVPSYRLRIDQNSSLRDNNVNLEIFHLAAGDWKGGGASIGAGVSYVIRQGMSAGLSYTFIRNTYSGDLNASTPVLGYEILPIAHQLTLDFEDKMNNHLLACGFDHTVTEIWSYFIKIEYLTSGNRIHYNYKVLTEFGIGSNKEENNDRIVVDLYKIGVATKFNIMSNFGIQLLFDQFIPVINKSKTGENIPGQPSPPGETTKFNKNTWGGSIYSLSIFYNVN